MLLKKNKLKNDADFLFENSFEQIPCKSAKILCCSRFPFTDFKLKILYRVLYTQKKVVIKEEENALSKFLSQFPLNLRAFLSL